MIFQTTLLLSLFYLGLYHASAFQAMLPTATGRKTISSFPFHDVRFNDKYFQLEEMEDLDRCTTELLLRADQSVQIGLTDGPRHSGDSVGSWQILEDAFLMTLSRKFTAGQSNTDMGQFSYEVKRIFEGEVTMIGNLVGIAGSIRTDANQEVGYFNMIDTTEDRETNIDITGGKSISSRGF